MKIKTFTQSLEIFKTAGELEKLDNQVNDFLASGGAKRVVSVSDTTTTGDNGTIGIIRVLAYEDLRD